MTRRPDQVRDRDSIQRDTISANIFGPVNVNIHQNDLDICEPETSANANNAKFRFRFLTLHGIEKFAKDILSEVKRVKEAESDQ